MPTAEAFPLYFPTDVRRAFETDEATRRFGTVAGLGSGSKVLELAAGRGTAALVLAREFGCDVVAVEFNDASLASLTDRVKSLGLTDRIHLRRAELGKLPFPEAEFDGIIVQGAVLQPATQLLKELRRLLAPRGRLAFTYPAKVGRFPTRPAVEFWEQRLGEALLLPREILALLQRSGFEPESVETLSDPELAELYRQAESKLDGSPAAATFKQELDLFRGTGRASVTYAFAIGRRREPGEKPPQSRDRG
ncbi:MAG: methyltransferase domain-containing protein [Myxococcota bacterium]|nr:methyltransferase domain-containing protein [Myxococcota bacterium]